MMINVDRLSIERKKERRMERNSREHMSEVRGDDAVVARPSSKRMAVISGITSNEFLL